MKVTLDLDNLLEDGLITREEHGRLAALAKRDTSSLATGFLIGLGVVSVSGAFLVLLPEPRLAMVLGFGLSVAGVVLKFARRAGWSIGGRICVLVGMLLLMWGTLVELDFSTAALWIVAGMLGVAGALVQSTLLTVIAVLLMSTAISAGFAYEDATYILCISKPAVTVALFTVMAVAMYMFSRAVRRGYREVAIAASRTSVLLVSFGFWAGSLWGDRNADGEVVIEKEVFVVGWAVALLAAGAWGWWQNRRWLVNAVAVFIGIHFFTQLFSHFGASWAMMMVAGVLVLLSGVGLHLLNKRMVRREAALSAGGPAGSDRPAGVDALRAGAGDAGDPGGSA